LLSGLVRIVRSNLDLGVSNVAVFSLGKVFWRDRSFREGRRLAAAVCPALPTMGVGSRGISAEFVDVKGIVEAIMNHLAVPEVRWTPLTDVAAFHPGKTARIEVAGESVGILGSLHPAVEDELNIRGPCWLFEIDFDCLLQYCPTRIAYRDLSRFPAVVRDVAIVTDESFASDRLLAFVREWNKERQLIEDVSLFDEYSGPPIPTGKKSLAYSVSYRAADRTLTDAEVNEIHMQLIGALKNALAVEPR
jgi:phenylalanyl-tRNA synthetase beta chain